MSKRDTLMVHIKWFYRTNEVPEQVYQLLIQDRNTEHHNFNKAQVRFFLPEKSWDHEDNFFLPSGPKASPRWRR
jgi:hypothetical protein